MQQSKIATEYKDEGYIPHFSSIHEEVANDCQCDKCGNDRMEYIGMKLINKEEFSGQTCSSYVAIAHCSKCGHEFEF